MRDRISGARALAVLSSKSFIFGKTCLPTAGKTFRNPPAAIAGELLRLLHRFS
jgi:hypothetical protein